MKSDISIQEAKNLLASNPSVKLIDVRTVAEYATGHIEGSVNIPLSNLIEIYKQFPDRQTPILVHCKSGGRSYQAKDILVSLGYTNVLNIGGINGWPLTRV